jgi:hypothetical protein
MKKNKPNPNDIIYAVDGREFPASELKRGDKVLHIAGLWRLQNKFPHEIKVIENKEFVINEKLKNSGDFINFYSANMVGENCYGRFIIPGGNTHIVANCGIFWGYGVNADAARAFLLSNAIKEPNLKILKTISEYER